MRYTIAHGIAVVFGPTRPTVSLMNRSSPEIQNTLEFQVMSGSSARLNRLSFYSNNRILRRRPKEL